MINNTSISSEIIKRQINNSGIKNIGLASIREMRKIINKIEEESGQKFIRMEMGVPGLKPPAVAMEAEIESLQSEVSSKYPDIDGIHELKYEISRFAKNFIDIEVSSRSCIPTVGSINGAFISLMVAGRAHKKQDTVLFLDPGFPVHKQLVKMLGLKQTNFDVYNYRGEKLRDKLESFLASENISTILYSNPNNPSWICFTEKELQIIGELANRYNITVLEDLAYFAMDSRTDLSVPGKAPFQPTVARYTDNYVLLISSSKTFNYAGSRIGMMLISDKLFDADFQDLLEYYSSSNFGHAVLFGTIYPTTAGVSHSSQYGLAAILKAVNDGKYKFTYEINEYSERAKIMKSIFCNNGFKLVYDKDEDQPLADGFFFTVSYQGMSGEELVKALFFHGISAISLEATGSERKEGIRACVSQVSQNQFLELEKRLQQFHQDNNVNHKNCHILEHDAAMLAIQAATSSNEVMLSER